MFLIRFCTAKPSLIQAHRGDGLEWEDHRFTNDSYRVILQRPQLIGSDGHGTVLAKEVGNNSIGTSHDKYLKFNGS